MTSLEMFGFIPEYLIGEFVIDLYFSGCFFNVFKRYVRKSTMLFTCSPIHSWDQNDDTYVSDTKEINETMKEVKESLSVAKHEIDPVCKEWDKIKRGLHEYEYVYTSANPFKNLSELSPISRSYFKMKEMLKVFQIPVGKNAVCLAEAPGGFIQCLLETNVKEITGITLISNDYKTPYWNRMLFRERRVTFTKGISGDGDLYSLKNIFGFIQEIGKASAHLVTGDGGFDNSEDYNNQEINSLKLIYSEIFLALHIQEIGGCFICKLFDTFELETISLLYMLHTCYEKISFYKPCISRLSNSEKYVVCQGFKGYDTGMMNLMIHHFEDNQLYLDIPVSFYKDILKFTGHYCDTQIKSIEKGLEMIRNHTYLKDPTSHQISVGKQWCQTYQVSLNTKCKYLRGGLF